MHNVSPLLLIAASLVAVGCTASPVAPTTVPAPTPKPGALSPAPAVAVSPAVAPSPSPAASPAASPSPSPAGSPAAVALTPVTTDLQITGVTVGPSDSTLTLRNTGTTIIDLAGWELRIGPERATLPSGATVPPGQSLTIHTGSGTDTATDLYLGTRAASLANGFRSGAQVALVDPAARPVVQFVIP